MDFVKQLVEAPCFYCGATHVQMTLDRIDNNLAHTKENVNGSCLRCNLIRGTMPYLAWMHLVPKIREAVEQGLFGEWRTQPIKPKHERTTP